MIIKATRISTSSDAGKVGGYMFASKDNDAIECLQGVREDVEDMMGDAKRHGATYAIRHVTISPEQATTREHALDQVRRYAQEFGADAERAVVVEHTKQREDAAGFERHWHAMLPEVDGGRVLDSSWMRARHEKLSRIAEIELGHDLVPGRWNAAVERALRAEGREDLALRVAPLAQGARPVASYTSDEHPAARRGGRSMPHTKATATTGAALWASADAHRAAPVVAVALVWGMLRPPRRAAGCSSLVYEATGRAPWASGATRRARSSRPSARSARSTAAFQRPGTRSCPSSISAIRDSFSWRARIHEESSTRPPSTSGSIACQCRSNPAASSRCLVCSTTTARSASAPNSCA